MLHPPSCSSRSFTAFFIVSDWFQDSAAQAHHVSMALTQEHRRYLSERHWEHVPCGNLVGPRGAEQQGQAGRVLITIEIGDSDLRVQVGRGKVLDELIAAVLEPERRGVVAQAPGTASEWGSGLRLGKRQWPLGDGSGFFGQPEDGPGELGKQRINLEIGNVDRPPSTRLVGERESMSNLQSRVIGGPHLIVIEIRQRPVLERTECRYGFGFLLERPHHAPAEPARDRVAQ